MPGLYSKLVEAKKGSVKEMTPAIIEAPLYKSQARISNRESTKSSSERAQDKAVSIFVTSKEPKEVERAKEAEQE